MGSAADRLKAGESLDEGVATVDLPLELQNAIGSELARVSPRKLAVTVAELSERYRAGSEGTSGAFLRSADDIAAYTAFRFPATYAAIFAVLIGLRDQLPAWRPKSLLDVGAGPGTALWAAAETWPDLQSVTMLEREDGMIALGRRIAQASPLAVVRDAIWQKADVTGAWDVAPHGMVTCAYVLGELQQDDRCRLVERLWEVTSGVLVLIEPGTVAGSARIREAREQVLKLGGKTAAPCPHDSRCPLPKDDWCHFSQRAARSRLHRQVKSGELGYEDEKFSYVAVARIPVEPILGRILRHPRIGKGHVKLTLCTPQGLESKVVTRKDKELYRKVRDLGWGSAVR